MKISRTELDDATARGILSNTQAEQLWALLAERHQTVAAFRPAHILYYLGGLIAIGAMTLFMTLGWSRFGGGGLLIISTCYVALAIGLTEILLQRGLALPAGLLAALVVVNVPPAIYGAEHLFGVWPPDHMTGGVRDFHILIDWRWVPMELGTLLAGLLVLWRYRLPFTVMPIAATLWYTSMDLGPALLQGRDSASYFEHCKWLSVGFGLLTLTVALVVDLRNRRGLDFAFWLYLFGVLTFWGGLTSLDGGSEFTRLVYAVINVGLIAIGAALARRVFAVFGALGVSIYLGHLSQVLFRDSLLFPVMLTVIGFAIIGAGILWQKHEADIGLWLRRRLPDSWRALIERAY